MDRGSQASHGRQPIGGALEEYRDGEVLVGPDETKSPADRPTLAADLARYDAQDLAEGSPFPAAYDRLVQRLAVSFEDRAPVVGAIMPAFLLVDASGRLVALEDVLAAGPAVISFNRGHWCPYCEYELAHYADFQPDFAALGARILAITPERQAFSRPFVEKYGGAITFLTDIDNGYALSLGLVMSVGTEVHDLLVACDCDLERYQGNAGWLLPVPATFVVEADGRVAGRFVEVDFRKRMEVSQALDCLRAAAG